MEDLKLVSSFSLSKQKKHIFDENIWLFHQLGYSKEEIGSKQNSINFSSYKLDWLSVLAKETVWKKRSSVGFNTQISYVAVLRKFGDYLYDVFGNDINIDGISRQVIEGYLEKLTKLSPATQRVHQAQLSEIFYCWNEWGFLSEQSNKLIHRDDKPRQPIKRKPRFLTAPVQEDISNAIEITGKIFDELSTTFPMALCRVTAVLQETGMRGNEALHLKKDCLSQDPSGDWHLTRINSKVANAEHMVPITNKLYSVIRDQLKETEKLEEQYKKVFKFPNPEEYLFVRVWAGSIGPYSLRHYNRCLDKLSTAIGLKDELGIKKSISSHVFRHTVGTNLINSGVSQHLVQKYLGHATPAMTAVYAEIHDDTLKKALQSFAGRMVDIKGKFYDATDVLCEMDIVVDETASLDSQWLKHNIATQTLSNGVCALPARQGCPHANKCLSCNSFRTDASFLPVHKEQLVRTNIVIEEAKAKNYLRQVEINQKVAGSLVTVIEALEVND